MGSARDELILALEENGYAEKKFSVIASPIFGNKELMTLLTKEGVSHKIRIYDGEYRGVIYIYFVYLFGSGYDDIVISIERHNIERYFTLSKFMNVLIEAISKIEDNLFMMLESRSLKLVNVHSIKDREVHDYILSFRIVYTLTGNNKAIVNEIGYFIKFDLKTNSLKVFHYNNNIFELIFSSED